MLALFLRLWQRLSCTSYLTTMKGYENFFQQGLSRLRNQPSSEHPRTTSPHLPLFQSPILSSPIAAPEPSLDHYGAQIMAATISDTTGPITEIARVDFSSEILGEAVSLVIDIIHHLTARPFLVVV